MDECAGGREDEVLDEDSLESGARDASNEPMRIAKVTRNVRPNLRGDTWRFMPGAAWRAPRE